MKKTRSKGMKRKEGIKDGYSTKTEETKINKRGRGELGRRREI